MSAEKRQEMFDEQLLQLYINGYLSQKEYGKMIRIHKKYKEDQQTFTQKQKTEKPDRKESVVRPASAPVAIEKKRDKPEKKKKVKTSEQIRERNITWSLILGVCLLLITGLIIATSQWEQMGPGLKVFSISFVSLFFLGLSYMTGKFLKIKQTAFAFLTLGSLLIPVAILAIGYFGLLGSYLSLFGEGRHVLGLMGTLLPLPLYIRHAIVHQSRLYVWISYVFTSLSVGFTLGALPLTVDVFYLLLMVYNAAIVAFYARYKQKWNLFMKDVPLYAQLNLVLSTLLMLFFFENEVFYSFNLLLTAGIYMAMVFVAKTKEYQFVFAVMLVYAVYQLVEHSPLQAVDELVYAVVGLLYLGFGYAFRNHSFIEKVFRYTSGVVSFCAFVYISYESILLREEYGSWMLFLAYALITANYHLIATLTKQVMFEYMAPIFFYVTLWQLWELTEIGPWFFFLFITAAITSVWVGIWGSHHWLSSVKESTLHISVFVLAVCLTYALYAMFYGYGSFMLVIISMLAYLVKMKAVEKEVREAAIWIQPLSLWAGSMVLYERIDDWLPALDVPFALYSAVIGILLLLLHLVWKKWKEEEISRTSFYTGQGSYLLGMVLIIDGTGVDHVALKPLMFLVGIAILFWLVQFTKVRPLWSLVSATLLAFYISFIDLLGFQTFFALLVYMSFAPVLFVIVAETGERKWKGMRPYFYCIAHIIQPLVIAGILLGQVSGSEVNPLILFIPLSVYVYSSWRARQEWHKKVMLYSALTTLFFLVQTVSGYYRIWQELPEEYLFLAMSLLIALIWLVVPYEWKRRIEWYWIPFSIAGLYVMVTRPLGLAAVEVIPILSFVGLQLFFLHRRNWSIARLVPLLLTIPMWQNINMDLTSLIFVYTAGAIVLMATGCFSHNYLIGPGVKIDAYSWSALVYIIYMNHATLFHESVWIQIIPVVLISAWLFMNAEKWAQPLLDRLFNTAGAICLYAAYVLVLLEYHWAIPDLLEAELQMLPSLALLLYVRKRQWREFSTVMNHIQLGLLLLIAGFLVIDAIQSHTIWDAWIIGGLALISMITGMQLKIKAYFFVGMGVLIFNVLYQTKPYWGNAPWWVYLLLAGVALIGMASYNEWQKQQSDSNKPVEQKLKRLLIALKKWN